MPNPTPTLKTDSDGNRRWYVNGELHRTDGPSIEHACGYQEWWVNGKRHRTDGPAVECASLFKGWYLHGVRHRVDGPAFEGPDGSKTWWVNGTPHRTDGPAVERPDGTMEWWVNGQEISTPYSHVLTAAFARGLPIPQEVLTNMLKAIFQKQGPHIDTLNSILHEYWPTHVKKILVTLLSNPDPATKHTAFSLLGHYGAARKQTRQCAPLAYIAQACSAACQFEPPT